MIFSKDLNNCRNKTDWQQSYLLPKQMVFFKLDENKTEGLKNLHGACIPMPIFLSNGLQNNIDEIETLIDKEKNVKKRHELQKRRNKCLDTIKEKQTPISTEKELNNSLFQIRESDNILQKIKTDNLDERDIDYILTSDLSSFIDTKFRNDIEDVFLQMVTNDRVQNVVFHKSLDDLHSDADIAWSNYKVDLESSIAKLKTEAKNIESNSAKTRYSRNIQHKKIAQIKQNIDSYEKQLKEQESWKHRYRTLSEKDQSKSVMSNVRGSVIDKLKNLFESAKILQIEQIHIYMKGKFNDLEQKIDNYKPKEKAKEEWLKIARNQIQKGKNLYLDPNICNPIEIGKIVKSLNDISEVLDFENKEINSKEDLIANIEVRSNTEDTIRKNHKKILELLDNLKDSSFDELEEKIKRYFKSKYNFLEDSAVVKKRIDNLKLFKDENTKLEQYISEFKLEVQNIDKMDAEELTQLNNDLIRLNNNLDFLEEPNEAIKQLDDVDIHDVLLKIEQSKTAQDIKEILLENFTKNNHINIINHSDFENFARKHTADGHMIIEMDGNDWRISIDESSLNGDIDITDLKKQITHELLHIEFETNNKIKAEFKKIIVENSPTEWANIRAAFVKRANENHIVSPNGTPFKNHKDYDDYILSELYAMQNEIGRNWRHPINGKESSTDKLNNLLVSAGLGKAIANSNKEKQFNEDGNIERFGYQSGAEKGEEGNRTSVNTEKISMSKEEAVYKKNEQEINALKERIKELRSSKYLQYTKNAKPLLSAMNTFNEGTVKLNKMLLGDSGNNVISTSIAERNNKLGTELNDVEAKIGKAASHAPNDEIGLFRTLWINTTFISLDDIGQVAIDAFEFFDRRHKRVKADHAAQLGMTLFNGTDLGREAYARQQKAEAEEVQEWQSRYENLDAWQLTDEIKKISKRLIPSPDQLKAILRILAKKGRINWLDENLWICLNKMQSSIELLPKDRVLLHNPVLLRQKLNNAMGEIWDYDEYSSLLRENEGAYNSEKSKYNSEHNRSADTLTQKLDDLLARHRDGEQIDPIEYESIIEYCLKNGKSYAENIMFHLIAGMGAGILPPDRGLALNENSNIWPALDYFLSFQPPYTADDFKRLCENEFPTAFNAGSISDGSGEDFMNWYWRVPQNDQSVIERVQKSVGERGWDHDWGRSIACLGSAQTAKQFLAGRSGQQETKQTAVGNAYVGAVQWLEENALRPEFATKEKFAKIAGWIAMSEGILNGTAYNRSESDISTRQNETMNSTKPREAGVGRHGSADLRAHREITQQFLFEIDAGFFEFLNNASEARSKEKKQELGKTAAQYLTRRYPGLADEMQNIEEIDQIYERLDLIIDLMFNNMSESRFKEILGNISIRASK